MRLLELLLLILILIGAGALITYELIAAVVEWWPTISEAYWALQNTHPWYAAVIVIVLALLIGHFWFRWWGPSRRSS